MSYVSYEIVDVFTDRPFTGNPLAVVFGADALDRDQMQALAREFHLSETVFVLAPTVPEATYRARIFTPENELPFAGHPSVGVAVTQMRRGLFGPGLVRQECGAGILPIEVEESGRATLTGGTPCVFEPLDPAPLLAGVGLTDQDYAGPPPRQASCGLDWTYLRVRPDAVARAVVPRSGMINVFAWDEESHSAHTRVFAPGSAVAEDPATGSAALGLGVWLVASGLLPGDGESSYLVKQGAELHRPSTLDCTVSAVDGQASRVTVSGSVVPIASGQIAVPPFVG
jgi:trans-2,3-dihydro-3-hydroxyanthranilate isomerase